MQAKAIYALTLLMSNSVSLDASAAAAADAAAKARSRQLAQLCHEASPPPPPRSILCTHALGRLSVTRTGSSA